MLTILGKLSLVQTLVYFESVDEEILVLTPLGRNKTAWFWKTHIQANN
jgi:hypothetical protein